MNTLFLRNIQIDSVIGVYDWERTNPQTLLLDLDLSLADNQAGLTDDLQYAVNYADLVEKLRLVARQSQRHLIEALAEDLSTCILSEFKVKKMRLCLIKQGILPQVGQVGVEIVRPIQE
ncbi:MAG: dihydroneopterin aldolase [Neisseriaceae bacterium]|nr:dihydroneopterin aldolase [Neisseriaceae bacterium]